MSDFVDIWHGSIPANPKAASFYRQYLSDDELARADRFRLPDLQHKFAQRRGMLRVVLSEYLAIRPQAIRFQMNSYGKPFLAEYPGVDSIQFSLSHSQDRMLIAVTCDRFIGIDVEVIRQDIDDLGLAESFFALEDVSCIRAKSTAEMKRRAFFDIWTGKEAYVKALGAGLSIPLDQFSIDMDLERPRLRYARHRCHDQIPLQDWHFEALSLAENESSCLAVVGSTEQVSVRDFASLAAEHAQHCVS